MIGLSIISQSWFHHEVSQPNQSNSLDNQQLDSSGLSVPVNDKEQIQSRFVKNTDLFDTVKVNDFYELQEAVNFSKRLVILKGKSYRTRKKERGLVRHLTIKNVENLTIEGVRDSTEIISDDGYSFVIYIKNSKNVVLRNLIVGHDTKSGSGGVIDVWEGSDISFENCSLYGSGTIGLNCRESQRITLDSSNIFECAPLIANIENCYEVVFNQSRFHKNSGFFTLKNSKLTELNQCLIDSNSLEWNREIAFKIDERSGLKITESEIFRNGFNALTDLPSNLILSQTKISHNANQNQFAIYEPSRFQQSDTASVLNAVGFNGLKYGSDDILVRPWSVLDPWLGLNGNIKFMQKESIISINTDSSMVVLNQIPEEAGLVNGYDVWIFIPNSKPFLIPNKIETIKLVEGIYGYDGLDLALEVTLEEAISYIPTKRVARMGTQMILMNKPLPEQLWSIEETTAKTLSHLNLIYDTTIYSPQKIILRDQIYVLLSIPENKQIEKYWESTNPIHVLLKKDGAKWSKIYEDRKRETQVVADIDGDNFPEFYIPFPDSHEGNLVSINRKKINIGFSSGH